MMKCKSHNKISYNSHELAEDALIQTRAKFHHSQDAGPVAVYFCPDCGGYHLTSKGEKSEVLNADKTRRNIEIRREADYWESKFKGRW